MPLRRQVGSAGLIFHVTNRAIRRARLFEADSDYAAFIQCLANAKSRVPLRLFAYCVMPNHFHLVLQPLVDGQLGEFMRLTTGVHSKRWHGYRGTTGLGAVYQGRYKAFPIQTGRHFFAACRYVESNALRASLVSRAEDWPWSSLAQRNAGRPEVPLDDWPVPPPQDWATIVNVVNTQELSGIMESMRKSRPFGEPAWIERTANEMALVRSLRKVGRPVGSVRIGLTKNEKRYPRSFPH